MYMHICIYRVCQQTSFKLIIIKNLAPMRPTTTSNNNRNPGPTSSQRQQQPSNPNDTNNPNATQQQTQQNKGTLLQTAEQPKKKQRSAALKPQHFQNPTKGLRKLYELTNQIKWEDTMTTQSAMNLVVMTIKSWQTQLLPKYYYQYFLQRCQALGSDKQVSAYMSKVRRIHKGLDTWNEGGGDKNQNNDPNASKTDKSKKDAESDGQILDIGNNDFIRSGHGDSDGYANYQQDANQLQKFKQKAQMAKKMGQSYKQTNQKSQAKPLTHSNNNTNKTNQQEIDQLMDEDLRMFQEMNRRKNITQNHSGSKSKAHQQQDQDQGLDLGGESGVILDDDYYDD